MVAPTCFGITSSSSGSVPSAFWEMLNWGAVHWILWIGVLCLSDVRVENLPEDSQKRPKYIGSSARLYITVSNFTAAVLIYMIICLTAQNVGNFKFEPYIVLYNQVFCFWWQLYQEHITQQNRYAVYIS
jgi:Na+/H+-dicarboxylate symporter